jgi:hypothetical protein
MDARNAGVHVSGSIVEVLTGILLFVCIFFLVHRSTRAKTAELRKKLNAKMWIRTMWFRIGMQTFILQMTKNENTWSKAPDGKRVRLWRPWFYLYVPIPAKEFWSIQRNSELLDAASKLISVGEIVDADGQQYRVWAQNNVVQNRIISKMQVISPLLEPLHCHIASTRKLLFYDYRFHFGWFAQVGPLPTGLEKDPDRVFTIAKNTQRIFNEIRGRVDL